MSEQITSMRESLMSCAMGQMANLEQVDAKELGEVVDMIKDLYEAEYYCAGKKYYETTSKAMEDHNEKPVTPETVASEVVNMMRDENQSQPMYYGGPYNRYQDLRYDGDYTRMGYTDRVSASVSMPRSIHDARDGRSAMSRRGYMESKENHSDDAIKRQEIIKYVEDLTQDIMEMIEGESPENKKLMKEKFTALAQKIS